MPRAPWVTAFDPATARGLPVHVVVRDFPETLAVFRAAGLDPAEHGAAFLADLEAAAGDAALLDALTRATAWRRGSPAGESSSGVSGGGKDGNGP